MGSLLLIVLVIFIVLLSVSIPTVISDWKTQRREDMKKEF